MTEGLHLGASSEIQGDQRAHDVYEPCYNWLRNLKSGSGFRRGDYKEHTLTGTCCGRLLLEGLRKLQSMPPEARLSCGSYLQEFQDVDSGLFVDSYFIAFPSNAPRIMRQCDTCVFRGLFVQNQASVSSLFRRDAWEQAGAYRETSSMQGSEDWDLWISILELGYRAVVVLEVRFEYRIRLDSIYHGKTRRPENFGHLFREIVHGHLNTYRQYTADTITETGVQIAQLIQWIEEPEQAQRLWKGQSADCQRLAEEREQAARQRTRQLTALIKEWQTNLWVRLGWRLRLLKLSSTR